MINNELEPYQRKSTIAYFTMEIALRPEVHTYSGGLGVLAGDTARSAADLGLPVVFVSMISRQGYIHQEIDAAGHQVHRPDPWNPFDWCVSLPAKIAIELEGRRVWIRPWLYECKGA
ncbi:MAG: alpha-glucan family phosphorylase, partial [Bauldia sp.]